MRLSGGIHQKSESGHSCVSSQVPWTSSDESSDQSPDQMTSFSSASSDSDLILQCGLCSIKQQHACPFSLVSVGSTVSSLFWCHRNGWNHRNPGMASAGINPLISQLRLHHHVPNGNSTCCTLSQESPGLIGFSGRVIADCVINCLSVASSRCIARRSRFVSAINQRLRNRHSDQSSRSFSYERRIPDQ